MKNKRGLDLPKPDEKDRCEISIGQMVKRRKGQFFVQGKSRAAINCVMSDAVMTGSGKIMTITGTVAGRGITIVTEMRPREPRG